MHSSLSLKGDILLNVKKSELSNFVLFLGIEELYFTMGKISQIFISLTEVFNIIFIILFYQLNQDFEKYKLKFDFVPLYIYIE